VLYSADGGASFLPVQVNLTAAPVALDTTALAGGVGLLRVVATDGVLTGQADSAPFVMAVKPPLPYILSPEDGLHILYGTLLNLNGGATDVQDGGVAGDHLAWSNPKGLLGTGAMLSVAELPVGDNWITLTATNTHGLSASVRVLVTVDDDLELPGATLSVAPLQVAWYVPVGTTQVQMATVSINNVGSGELSWTANGGTVWLTLSSSSGTAPAEVTLFASPAGLPEGTTLATNLVVTASGGQTPQTAVVPVSLTVGDGRFLPGEGHRLYLPVVLKKMRSS